MAEKALLETVKPPEFHIVRCGMNWKGMMMHKASLVTNRCKQLQSGVEAMRAPIIDSFGRRIDYLRISVTDRCNFRCVYCMPPEGIPLLAQDDILTFEEITRVARLFLQMGGRKIRITGGEPLVRKNLPDLVAKLARLPILETLGLTTNGFYLEEWAAPLREAGLKYVNISLDSLRPSRFAWLTHCPGFENVWKGVEEAIRVGLKTKINVVVLRGIAEEEIFAFGEMAKRLPLEIRFIEFMPLCGTGWHPEWMISIREIRELLQGRYSLISKPRGSEVADSYQIAGGKGSVGFIASMTEPFCNRCSRLRLTAEGKLRPCLFSNREIDLKPKLRGGWPDVDLTATIMEAIRLKPAGHKLSVPIRDAKGLPRIRFVGG